MDRIHIALSPPGYPHVDAVLRAVELSRRPGASFSRSLGWPLPPHPDQFVHWLLDTGATHALLRDGDVVPPPDVLDRLLEADVPAVTAAYPQWVDDRLAANVQAVADQTWSDTIPRNCFRSAVVCSAVCSSAARCSRPCRRRGFSPRWRRRASWTTTSGSVAPCGRRVCASCATAA